MIISQEEYYTAPSDDIFEDIQKCSIFIWSSFDAIDEYKSEKIDRIKDLSNISDNALFIVSMFDIFNQAKLLGLVKDETKNWLGKFLDSNNYWW